MIIKKQKYQLFYSNYYTPVSLMRLGVGIILKTPRPTPIHPYIISRMRQLLVINELYGPQIMDRKSFYFSVDHSAGNDEWRIFRSTLFQSEK